MPSGRPGGEAGIIQGIGGSLKSVIGDGEGCWRIVGGLIMMRQLPYHDSPSQ